ncbi:phosphatidylinositol 3-kinase, putative, partial [Bodo saltans]
MSVSDSRDAIESEIKRLLEDLLQCASTVHARTVLRDAVWAIEDRASSRTDAHARDPYVEQRVRDALGELSKPGSTPQSYEIAIEFVDALLPIDFTERNYKFARLCRSLLVILQSGHDGIVKFAQRVFIRMVEMDVAALQKEPHAPTPLKDFLPKELKEMCETVSREADGRGTPSRNKSLAVMIASEAVMIVYPRYFSTALRSALIDLAIDLCGRPDLSVRCAAYDCLVATLTNTGGLKAADVQVESRRLADECTKSLRASHVTDHQSTSTILSLRALLVSRGVNSVDKQFFNMFCTTLLEQHKKAKGDLVRSAVCSLVPIVAKADPNFSSRKISYAMILMDPLKNIRDESNKMTELHNMAEYVRSAGWDSLDPSMKPSIEQLLLRYVTRPQTQLECWNMLAAIAAQIVSSGNANPTAGGDRPNSVVAQALLRKSTAGGAAGAAELTKLVDIIRKCLPNLARAPLTETLLEYLEQIKTCISQVAAEVASAKRNLIDVVLRRAAQAESTQLMSPHRQGGQWSGSSPLEPFLGSPAALVGSSHQHMGGGSSINASFASAPPSSASAGNPGSNGRSFGNLGRLVSSYFHRGNSNSEGGVGDDVILVTAAEIEVALVALSKRPVDDFSGLVEELRVNIIALQRHSNSEVRRQCSQTILQCVERACSAAGMQQRISPESASHFFSKVEDLLESFLKNAVMELEPQCRMTMVETFCQSRSAMQLINRPKILNTLMSFLNDTSRIRELVVRAFVEACQSLKKDGVDVSAVETQLKTTVETSVVALEYSSETRLLLRHLGDLVIFTRFGIDPIIPLMTRTFVALNRKLGSSDQEMDVVVLSILKTLKCLIGPLISNDSVGHRFLDEIATLQATVLSILWNSTAPVISIEAVRVLVALNNVSPLILNISSSDALKTIETLSSTFLDSKLLPKDDLVAIMTLFGQVGAIRPTKGTLESRSDDEQSRLASDADLVITFDYAVIVYRSISRMLETSLPESVAITSMRVLLQLVNATSKEEIGGVHALKAVLNLIKLRCDTPTLRVEALYQLAALISKRHQNTIAFMLPEIVVLLDQLWTLADGVQFCAVLEVVTALEPGTLPSQDQHDMWPWLYPRLIDAVLRDSSPNREVALRIVEIVNINAKSIPAHCVPFITSALTNVIQASDQPSELRAAAIVAVVEVVNSLDLIQFVTPFLHALRTLYRHLELSHALGRRFGVTVRDALRRFMKKFPSSRTIVTGVVDLLETTDNHHHDDDNHDDSSPIQYRQNAQNTQNNNLYNGGAVSTTSSRRTLDGNDPLFRISSANSDGNAPPAALSQNEPNRADLLNLQGHVERGIRITDHSRWREWYQELQRLVMLCSPHFAFRLVTDLFEKHEPLRRDLFFAGFKCLYSQRHVKLRNLKCHFWPFCP